MWRHLFREGIGSHQRCLDIGCGTGLLTVQLALNGAAHVNAIDLDERAVANTLTNAFRNGVAERVTAAAVDLYPWVPEERYDRLRGLQRAKRADGPRGEPVRRLSPSAGGPGRDGQLPARGHSAIRGEPHHLTIDGPSDSAYLFTSESVTEGHPTRWPTRSPTACS